MRRYLLWMAVLGCVVCCQAQTSYAQQQTKRQVRPVTITYQSTGIVRTQWSPSGPGPVVLTPPSSTPTANVDANTGRTSDQSQPDVKKQPSNPSLQTVSMQQRVNSNDEAGNWTYRPTYQQLQNPSGDFQMTHLGFSQSWYMSPNNYLGSDFNSWNNLYGEQVNQGLFESFNRFQPSDSGFYSSSASFGTANYGWSNLSGGSIVPSEMGGWSYLP